MEIEQKHASPIFISIALFAVLFLAIFNYTLSIMASLYIVGDLGGSNDIATYSVTFFGLGNALGIPLGGAFLKRIGPVKLLVCCLLFFAFFSWTCASSANYPIFIASRFFLGF